MQTMMQPTARAVGFQARPLITPARSRSARSVKRVHRFPKSVVLAAAVPATAVATTSSSRTIYAEPPSVQALTFPAGAPVSAYADVAAQFDKWNAALQTLDPAKVADCYASDAVLLPTVSNLVRTTRDDIIDYFKVFLTLKPRGVIDESQVRLIGAEGNVAANSGIYTFTIEKDGREQKVQARFTFIYKKVGGEWKIAEHHSSAMPEHAEVAAQFDRWNAALATLDPQKVADCYGPGAVLLPTVSNQVRTTRAAIVDYFTNFLKLKPQGVIDEGNVRVLANGLALYAGVYTFTLQKDGKPTKVQARFSYIYKKFGAEWKIMEHHSSAMPEKAPTAPTPAQAAQVVAKPVVAESPKPAAVAAPKPMAAVVEKAAPVTPAPAAVEPVPAAAPVAAASPALAAPATPQPAAALQPEPSKASPVDPQSWAKSLLAGLTSALSGKK